MSSESISMVVNGGFCVGCGACSVATRNRISIDTDPKGWYLANLSRSDPDDLQLGSRVCPFADEAQDENQLSDQFVVNSLMHRDARLGSFSALLAGRIVDDEKVAASSSGGLTTWLLEELLREELIDGVIHVAAADGPLFVYEESLSISDLRQRGKSRYFAVEFSKVLARIRGNGKRYAFVGVPCFAKAVRLLCREDPVLRDQIRFVVALVCGHMKSFRYAELLAWQQGIRPTDLAKVDFRVKNPSRQSSSYDVGAWARDSSTPRINESVELYGNNWGYALMQLRACDFCDDIMGETADITFGDAWLPRYRTVWQGTNLVVSRSALLERMLRQGAKSGQLLLEDLTRDEAAATQDGNYRHRWDGLSVRLADAKSAHEWTPHKRIAPDSIAVPEWRRRIIRLRVHAERSSHVEFQKARLSGDLAGFVAAMRRITDQIDRQYMWGKLVDGIYWRKLITNPRWLLVGIARKLGLI